jgi:hypothetical protein
MRNPAFTLSPAQVIAANYFRGQVLSRPQGEWITVSGVKRDGSERTYVGAVEGLVGKDSHEAVVINTRDGRKSMNLYNIRSLRPAQVLS